MKPKYQEFETFGVTEKKFGEVKTTGAFAAFKRYIDKSPYARPIYGVM